MTRFEWKELAGNRYQLIDVVSHKPVASIEPNSGGWRWLRNTTMKHQGAPQGDGTAATLAEAQAAVLNGLRNE